MFVFCWGFTAQSTKWGQVERGQFSYIHNRRWGLFYHQVCSNDDLFYDKVRFNSLYICIENMLKLFSQHMWKTAVEAYYVWSKSQNHSVMLNCYPPGLNCLAIGPYLCLEAKRI